MLSYLLLPLLLTVLGFAIVRTRHWTCFWALMFLPSMVFMIASMAQLAIFFTSSGGVDPGSWRDTAFEEFLFRTLPAGLLPLFVAFVVYFLYPLGLLFLVVGIFWLLRRLFDIALPFLARCLGRG